MLESRWRFGEYAAEAALRHLGPVKVWAGHHKNKCIEIEFESVKYTFLQIKYNVLAVKQPNRFIKAWPVHNNNYCVQ